MQVLYTRTRDVLSLASVPTALHPGDREPRVLVLCAELRGLGSVSGESCNQLCTQAKAELQCAISPIESSAIACPL